MRQNSSSGRAIPSVRRSGPILAGVIALTVASATFAAEGERTFSHPDRIRYDSHCMTIDGKDMVIYSGSFHYFRCPKELWRDRFTKIKEAGFNTVETYVPWNVHEAQMPADLGDFSKIDLKDADDWITMAEEFGFYVIIRPGPYICAEWDHGGFPGWLITKRPEHTKEPIWYRSDDPVFMAWSKHWMDAVSPMVAKHQITRKKPGEPGVILFQLENEYNYARFAEPIKSAYVKSLAEAAIAGGIDVPLFTCLTRGIRGTTDPVLRNVFDSCNFYPSSNLDKVIGDIDKLRAAQPDAPLMTTELQGGWFTTGLGAPTIRPDADTYRKDLSPEQINNLTLLVLAHGETMANYYMLFGGTNFGDTAAYNISTDYDYSAPIRECGGVGDKYLRVKALGQFIHDHGQNLARADAVECDVTSGFDDVTAIERRAIDGSRYLFIRTNQLNQPRAGTIHLKEKTPGAADVSFPYQLEPLGAKVLYLAPGVIDPAKGEWLPKAEPAVVRPTDLPAPITIADIQSSAEAVPTEWHPVPANSSLNDLGVYDSRFVYYHGTLKLSESDLKSDAPLNLVINHPGNDPVVATVNGQRLTALKGSGESVFPTEDTLHAGDNDMLLLYENAGTPNGGLEMEKRAGVMKIQLVAAPGKGSALSGWRMQLITRADQPAQLPEIAADAQDDKWLPVVAESLETTQLKPKQDAVFRTTVDVSDQDIEAGRTAFTVARVDDTGIVFVNGQQVGETKNWNQSYTFDAAKQLHAGKNSVAIFVHNAVGAGGLGPVTLSLPGSAGVGTVSNLSYAEVPPAKAADASKPDSAKHSSGTSGPSSLLSTERLTFELPDAKPGIWVPWLLRLHATGNGFLFVNGHALGRYWQQGKQFDFYLPECWLNFGAGKKNVVALSLRQLDKAVAVQSAEVMPYSVYAENR